MKKIIFIIGISLGSLAVMAQPVILNPLLPTTTENDYGGTAVADNNTGSDIASVMTTGGRQDVNVIVHEQSGTPNTAYLRYQYVGNSTAGPNFTVLGNSLGSVAISDPDVVAVVSSTSGIGNLKERLLVTFIADNAGVANVYLEKFEWVTSTSTFNSVSVVNITKNQSTGICKTPNIDADFYGNYAVVWEESRSIYLAGDNALTSWSTAPINFIDFSASCGLTRDEEEPDVCLLPFSIGGVALINVAFRSGNKLYLERTWTSMLSPGWQPFYTLHCFTMPFYYMKDFTDVLNPTVQMISDIRIACPPVVTATRSVYDMTIVFKHDPIQENIVTATHNLVTYGMATIAYNTMNGSGSTLYPSSGSPYSNKRPAIAYKGSPDEFVVGWEFTDGYSGTANAYSSFIPLGLPNNNKNLVAVVLDDASNFMHFDMSMINNVTAVGDEAEAISFSKGDIMPMACGYRNGNNDPIRYNNNFTGPNFKKYPETKLWFIDRPNYVMALDENNTNSNVLVFPNPIRENTGSVSLKLNNLERTEITILTMDGKIIFNKVIENTMLVSFENNFSSGAYLIKISGENSHQLLKFVVN